MDGASEEGLLDEALRSRKAGILVGLITIKHPDFPWDTILCKLPAKDRERIMTVLANAN
jgi:hypothetical protein